MKKLLLIIGFFFFWTGCDNSQRSCKKYETKIKESATLQLQFHVLKSGEIALLNDSGDFYYFDDEANYDKWALHALWAMRICEELHLYEEKKNNQLLSADNKRLIRLQNKYIDYAFDLPIKKQIADSAVKHCLNKVYYENKNSKLYLRDEGYGYKCYGLLSLKDISVKFLRQDKTDYLVIGRCE